MRLVATLIDNRAEAMKILRDVPDNSVILFPESVPLLSRSIKQYSIRKNLFVIYNSDIKIGDDLFITMRSINMGKELWRVRKFRLWKSDIQDGYSAAKYEPIVDVQGQKSALLICYDACEIFKIYHMLEKEQIELMFIPSNWSWNFPLMERIIDFSLEHIHTLKAVVFSNSNTFSLIKTRNLEKRITKTGYVQLRL